MRNKLNCAITLLALVFISCGLHKEQEDKIYVDGMKIWRKCISEDEARMGNTALKDEFSKYNGIRPELMNIDALKELKTSIVNNELRSSFNISLREDCSYDYETWKEGNNYFIRLSRSNCLSGNTETFMNYCKVSILLHDVSDSTKLFFAGVDWYDGNNPEERKKYKH